jgi:hypothetical protein
VIISRCAGDPSSCARLAAIQESHTDEEQRNDEMKKFGEKNRDVLQNIHMQMLMYRRGDFSSC